MKAAFLLWGLLAALPASAQETQIGLTDAAGNYFSVLNCFAGFNEYIQLKKTDPSGNILWTQHRNVMVDERAAAAAADPWGSIVIAVVRKNRGGVKTLVLLRYTKDGLFDLERFFNDSVPNVPAAVAVDAEGSIYVGGNALRNGRNVARLWKYDRYGTYMWFQEVDNGYNTYVRQLQVDLSGAVNIAVESFQSQTTTSGQYSLATFVYDKGGSRLWR